MMCLDIDDSTRLLNHMVASLTPCTEFLVPHKLKHNPSESMASQTQFC